MEVLSVALFTFFSWWALSVGVKTGTLVLDLWPRIILNIFVIALLVVAGASLVIGV